VGCKITKNEIINTAKASGWSNSIAYSSGILKEGYVSPEMFAEIPFLFEFKVPPQAPPSNVVFNYDIFKETTKEKVLTRAIEQ
jgi:hypothetical protein